MKCISVGPIENLRLSNHQVIAGDNACNNGSDGGRQFLVVEKGQHQKEDSYSYYEVYVVFSQIYQLHR